jgi:uncharacterized protein YprB with RNaseH-like and TPR domain
MELEDRLKLLKKARASRSRQEAIEKAWQKIGQSPELTTKEKLEKLISLTRTEPKKKEIAGLAEPDSREPFQVFENHFSFRSRYGRVSIGRGLKIKGQALSLLSRDQSFDELDLSSSLFLDLETTGLSGGVGVVPFLVGLGFYREAKFQVLQFFLGDLAAEEELIKELRLFFSQMNFRSVVTFNGKAFDLPLLETRFILKGEVLDLSGLPHLDFLFAARSLWGHKHESCRLYHLAREVLNAEREEDIPSAEIPFRYFQFLRSGDFGLVEPVLYHNQEDILSLLGVVIVGASFFAEEEEPAEERLGDAMDLFGAAKILERTGEFDKSALFIRKALEGGLSGEISLLARKKLASYFKKHQEWEKAVRLWQEMTPLNQLFCFRELAMYYEHRAKDYVRAKQVSEEGLCLASGVSLVYEQDFIHRLDRLKRKINRRLAEKS